VARITAVAVARSPPGEAVGVSEAAPEGAADAVADAVAVVAPGLPSLVSAAAAALASLGAAGAVVSVRTAGAAPVAVGEVAGMPVHPASKSKPATASTQRLIAGP
jgi:hypothetical protein